MLTEELQCNIMPKMLAKIIIKKNQQSYKQLLFNNKPDWNRILFTEVKQR